MNLFDCRVSDPPVTIATDVLNPQVRIPSNSTTQMLDVLVVIFDLLLRVHRVLLALAPLIYSRFLIPSHNLVFTTTGSNNVQSVYKLLASSIYQSPLPKKNTPIDADTGLALTFSNREKGQVRA